MKSERAALLFRINKIEAELKDFQTLTTVIKQPVTKSESKNKCYLCSGISTYNDRWAGFIDCPECKGAGQE